LSNGTAKTSQSEVDKTELEQAIAMLNHEYSGVGNLLRTLTHTVTCADDNVTIRAHYLPFRSGKPMTGELINVLRMYITQFALPRAEIELVHQQVEALAPHERMLRYNELRDRAADLFIKAQESTGRNGEAGELILYLLMEWALQAPQLLAKMSLKTSAQMPVHGSDGIHIRYDPTSQAVMFFWGEAKLHANIGSALDSAVTSVSDALTHDKMNMDIKLVQRHFSLLGFPEEAREALLSYLNPLHENYGKRTDVSACLIGFNFAEFAKVASYKTSELETRFCDALTRQLEKSTADLATRLKDAGISHHRMEVFFLPLGSVSDFRKEFQNAIGWKK
jgi:hypothetical protein